MNRLALLAAAAALTALAGCDKARTLGGQEGGGSGCTLCHGGTDNQTGAPPVDSHGATTGNYVGAHTAHVVALQIADATGCAVCHPNPGASGHDTDGPRAQVVFAGLATNNGTFTASYASSTFTCTVYCHGATLSGGAGTTPSWPDASLAGAPCGSCHGDPPLAIPPHTASTTNCAGCHPAVPGASHVNGTVDVTAHAAGYSDPAVHGPAAVANIASCQSCHGTAFDGGGFAPMDCNACHSTAGWNASALTTNCTFCHGTKTVAGYPSIANPLLAAPPRAVSGSSTDPAIGAHQAHLNAGAWANAFTCDQCHAVPATGDLSHITGGVTFAWGTLAAQGTTPTWNGTALTCTNYCHGATINATAPSSPAWNAGTIACNACHASRPTTGLHTASGTTHGTAACTECHIGYVQDTSVNLAYHVNGNKDVVFLLKGGTGGQTYVLTTGWTSCTNCHSHNFYGP